MQLIGIIIGQYLLKACLALLDAPIFDLQAIAALVQ